MPKQSINVLRDPLWFDRASPFKWMGSNRMHPPGILFEDFPCHNSVLLTHNHYDHLNLSTMIQRSNGVLKKSLKEIFLQGRR